MVKLTDVRSVGPCFLADWIRTTYLRWTIAIAMSRFPIRRVDRSRAQAVETLGSKPKFWYVEDNRRLLFKAEDRGTGEDWAEVIACHLCRLLGLPHVEYELAQNATAQQSSQPGAVCENMAPETLQLFLGNELLLARDPQYPIEQRFKVRQHTVQAVSDIVTILEPPAPAWLEGVPDGVQSALDFFVGLVMLDAWIANPDRHHENWAAIWDGTTMRLAPTFDHGASLARNLLDSERAERLTTKDRNRTIKMFAQRGRSAFFGSADRVHGRWNCAKRFRRSVEVPRMPRNRGWSGCDC